MISENPFIWRAHQHTHAHIHIIYNHAHHTHAHHTHMHTYISTYTKLSDRINLENFDEFESKNFYFWLTFFRKK